MPTDAPHPSQSPSLSADAPDATAAACAAASMVGDDRAAALAGALGRYVGDVSDYEASVRGSERGALRAGRMMIERAAPEVFPAIATALDVSLCDSADEWIACAERERVPMIAGWDLRGAGRERCVKLYVNASDAGREVRARLAQTLSPGLDGSLDPPAVLGMNVRADGITEAKLYLQSADAVAIAAPHGASARELARTASDEGAAAGGIVSYDADNGTLTPRAFFVALREPRAGAHWHSVHDLPGFDPHAIEALLPFPPAAPRSVGISLASNGWTLYFKPRSSMRAPEALEPTAVFRAGPAEVGIFVEATEHAAKAFRRTDVHAVSIRVREGEPTPHALETLVDWFTARLRVAEKGRVHVSTQLDRPPAPWVTVPLQEATHRAGRTPNTGEVAS